MSERSDQSEKVNSGPKNTTERFSEPLTDSEWQQALDKFRVEAVNEIESRVLEARGKKDSFWLTVGTLSTLLMVALAAVFGLLVISNPDILNGLSNDCDGGTSAPASAQSSDCLQNDNANACAADKSQDCLGPSSGDPSGQTNPYAFTQFMTLFLAIAAGGIAYLASAMGMKRLERYDEQFQKFREENQDFADRIHAQAEAIGIQLENRLDDKSSANMATLQEKSDEFFRKLSQEAREGIESSLEDVQSISDALDDRYKRLTESSNLQDVLVDHPSVGEIHKRVSHLFATHEREEARELTRSVLSVADPETGRLKTTGDLNDWFNLGSALGRNDEFSLGLQVNLAGLVQQGIFPPHVVHTHSLSEDDIDTDITPNVDLLSHAIQYADKIGEAQMLSVLVPMAKRLPKENRNWRYYQFLGDYYADRNDKDNFDQVVEEFRQRLPDDERSDNLELAWHQARQNDDKIDEIAENWIGSSSKRGSAVPLRLATIYLKRGDYEKVLQLTARALEGSSESQPNGSIGAMIFYRANAYDALFVRESQKEPVDCQELKRLFENACRLYRSDVFDLVSSQMRPAADQRLKAMFLLYSETDCAPPDLGDEGIPANPDDTGPQGGGLSTPNPTGDDDASGNVPPELKAAGDMVNNALRAVADGDMETFETLASQIEKLEGITRKVVRASLVHATGDEDYSEDVQKGARDLANRLSD